MVQAFLKKWWVESDFKVPNLSIVYPIKCYIWVQCIQSSVTSEYNVSSQVLHLSTASEYSVFSQVLHLSTTYPVRCYIWIQHLSTVYPVRCYIWVQHLSIVYPVKCYIWVQGVHSGITSVYWYMHCVNSVNFLVNVFYTTDWLTRSPYPEWSMKQKVLHTCSLNCAMSFINWFLLLSSTAWKDTHDKNRLFISRI